MLPSKIINYESIDALGTILMKSIFNGEEKRVLNNLKRFNMSIEIIFSISNDRFKEIMLNKENKENKSSYWTKESNYSSSFNSILLFYSECLKIAIESNKINIALEFKQSLNKILRKFLLKKKDIVLLEMFFFKQEELFKYCIDNNNSLSNSFGFHWYYDLTFDWPNAYSLFDLDFLELFDKQIFKYIKYAIDKKNVKWLNAWIDWIHSGIGFINLNKFSSYEYFDDFESDTDDFILLDEKFENIDSLKKFNEFVRHFTLVDEKFKTNNSINTDEKDRKRIDVIKKAEVAYLVHNIKNLLFSSFSYSLYKNSYDLLFQILNKNNSSKSGVIMMGHKILPQNINDIINAWIKEDIQMDDENWKFSFGNIFSENKYYESILTFIMIIHLELDKNSQLNIEKNYSIREMIFLKDVITYLIGNIDELDSYNDIFKKENESFNLESSKKNINDVLNILSNVFNNMISGLIKNANISKKCINELKKGFNEEYQNNSDNIKVFFSIIDESIIINKEYNENVSKFGLKNKLPRDYFFEETNTVVDYLGKQYAQNFLRSRNTDIFRKILDKAKVIFIDQLDEYIKSIGLENILILSTNHSEILNTNTNFKYSWEVINKLQLSNIDGYYEYEKNNIPIFSFYTNLDLGTTIIMNKKKSLTWFDYKPSLNEENISNNIYLSILDIGKDKETVVFDLYSSFELEFNKDFECFVIEG